MWQTQIWHGQRKLCCQSARGKRTALLAMLGMVLVACSGPQTQRGVPSPVTTNDTPDCLTSPTLSAQRGEMPSRSGEATVVQSQPVHRAQIRLMFMFQVPGQEPNQTVETALARKFQDYGYSVLDAGTVA